MRELWGRTWEMFRRNPVLWVPVIVADLVGHTLEAVRPMITANLVRWSMETHSVLGVTEYREAPGWLYWVVGLIRFGVWWVGACAYVVAAIVAAGMVRRLAEPKVEIAERKLPGLTYSGGVAWVGLLAMVVGGATAAVIMVPSLYTLQYRFRWMRLNPYIWAAEAAPAYFVVAYLVTPPLLKLVARAQGAKIGGDVIRKGRQVALTTAVVLVVVSFLVMMLKLPRSIPVLGYIRSCILALPYIPLFIALGVLAMEGDAEIADGPAAEGAIGG